MVSMSTLAMALTALAGSASAAVISTPYASYAPNFGYSQFGRTALDSTPYFVHHNAPVAQVAAVPTLTPYHYQPYYHNQFNPLFHNFPAAAFPASFSAPALGAPHRINPQPFIVSQPAAISTLPATVVPAPVVPAPVVPVPVVPQTIVTEEIKKPETIIEPAVVPAVEDVIDDAVVDTVADPEAAAIADDAAVAAAIDAKLTVSDPVALQNDPNLNYAIRRIFPVFNSDLRTGSKLIQFVNPLFAAQVSEKDAGKGVSVFGDDDEEEKKIVPTLYRHIPAGIAQAQQPTFFY